LSGSKDADLANIERM